VARHNRSGTLGGLVVQCILGKNKKLSLIDLLDLDSPEETHISNFTPPHWPNITAQILADYQQIPEEETNPIPRHIIPESIN